MKHLLSLRLAVCLLMCAGPFNAAQAALLGVTVSPKQADADITTGQSIAVRWVVSTTPAHQSGAFSAQGQLIDPVTGAVLHSFGQPLKRPDGAGPLAFTEDLALTPAQLQEWQQKGISAVIFQRSFASTEKSGDLVNGDLMIRLSGNAETKTPRAPSAGLFVHKLGLRFENARNRRSFTPGSSLRARVDLHYSGTGLLQGEWQIARTDTASAALFTPLVSVRKQLPLSRREYLVSPELPTAEPGQYRVRFCVIPQVITPDQLAIDTQCPEPELTTELKYQVGPDTSRESALIELTTARAITANPLTAFAWKPLKGASVYQLQVFRADEAPQAEGADFVLRLLAGGTQSQLHLSELAQRQLQTGKHYRWRITAHDENGLLIGISDFAEFTYLP